MSDVTDLTHLTELSDPDPEVRATAWQKAALDFADRLVEATQRAADYADRLAAHAQSTQCHFWPDA